MKARIVEASPEHASKVNCGTFHALCKRQLEKGRRRIRLAGNAQRFSLLQQAYNEHVPKPGTYNIDDFAAYVDASKANPGGDSPSSEDMLALIDLYTPAYHRYNELLERLGLNDFGDLLQLAVKGMQEGTIEPLEAKYILADEFQDTDRIQYAWLREHLTRGAQVTVVGDDDQSIYGWRNAMGYRGLESFRRASNARHISLGTTYRCAQEIMVPSARLITHNTERVKKNLATANHALGSVKLTRFATREDEFEGIIDAIAESGEPATWGVLARTNNLLERLEEAVSGRVPMARANGSSFWDLRGPSVLLALCQSISSGDMVGVDDVLKRSGADEGSIASLHAQCKSDKPGSLKRFLALKYGRAGKDSIARLHKFMHEWVPLARGGSGEMEMMFDGIAYYISRYVKLYKTRTEKEKVLDAKRLQSCAKTLTKLNGRLSSRLRALQDSREDGCDGSARLLTMHSSKGLEFDRVWIMACEEGIIPADTSPIPEERRLMYVAMTRARTELRLSCLIESKKNNNPSRFLEEAGIIRQG